MIIVAIILCIVITPGSLPFLLKLYVQVGIVATVSSLVRVYWFDWIPYQHHWNPSVRELYPYRQTRPEVIIMATLSTANLFHSRRRRKTIQLPTEIWEDILLWVIYTPYDFGAVCEPKTFHHFVRGHSSRSAHSLRFTALVEWINEAKMVSHLWMDILNRHTPIWIIPPGWPPKRTQFPHKIKRLDLSIDHYASATSLSNANHSATLPRLAVISARTTQSSTHEWIYRKLQFSLFIHASKYPTVGSFILEAPFGSIARNALAGIEISFLHITSLTLVAQHITGSLSLEQLDILILSAETVDTDEWRLPRLRHLATGHWWIRHFYHTNLIPGTSMGLRSLRIDPTQVLDADECFWSDHPSLEYLGVTSRNFQLSSPPPLDHPLAHIYFCDSEWPIAIGELPHTSKILGQIPQLKTVILPIHDPENGPASYPAQWLRLLREQRRRGITWYDPDGQEIEPPRLLLLREMGCWERYWIGTWIPYGIYYTVQYITNEDFYGKYINPAFFGLIALYSLFVVWDLYRPA